MFFGCFSSVIGFCMLCHALALSIKLEDGEESPKVVSAIEGSSFVLYCENNKQPAVWTKHFDVQFHVRQSNLTFDGITRQNAGDYTCTDRIGDSSKSVKISILYGPTSPTITGPSIVMKGSVYNLTCSSDSNPLPTYHWTTSCDSDSQIVARGRTYIGRLLDAYEINLYCWVENTMFPTAGINRTDRRTARQVKKTTVVAHEAAYIWELKSVYTFNTSTDMAVDCKVTGSPPPEVWWTRQDDASFRFNGARLFVRDVQLGFTGYYSCYAKNTVTPSGQGSVTTEDVQHTLITINDPGISESCRGSCRKLVEDTLDNTQRTVLITAAVIGWSLACILLTIVLIGCAKRRKNHNRKLSTELNGNGTRITSDNTNIPLTEVDNPYLHTRNWDQPVSTLEQPNHNDRVEEPPYSYVTGGVGISLEDAGPCVPTVCANTTDTSDYLQPVPSGGYLEVCQ